MGQETNEETKRRGTAGIGARSTAELADKWRRLAEVTIATMAGGYPPPDGASKMDLMRAAQVMALRDCATDLERVIGLPADEECLENPMGASQKLDALGVPVHTPRFPDVDDDLHELATALCTQTLHGSPPLKTTMRLAIGVRDQAATMQEYRQMCSNAQKAATSVLDQRDELYRKIVKWRDRVRTADHQEIVGLEDEMSAAVRKWEK